MAIKLADTARPNNYVDAEHLGTYPVAYAEDVWFADGTRLSDLELEGGSIQKTELPLASSTEEGKIYQYIGATGTYTNGYFYKCVEQTPTGFGRYEWQELKFVENPVVYSETVPAIQDYETGNVVLYTGTDTPVYFKGHSYRLIKQIISGRWFKINGDNYFAIGNSIAEGDYLFEFPDASSYVVPTYIVTSVSGDTITAQSVSNASTTISGEITNPTATAQSIAYWEDIGGGGSGNDYEEFVGTQAEWDALPQSQKDKYDGKIVNITDDEGENYKDKYSTTEVKTNKVWIDGKPIYRKAIACGALPNADEKLVPHGISNINEVFYINGIAIWDRGGGAFYSMPINYINPTILENSVGLYVNETNISIKTTNNLNVYTKTYIILEYTKTTD